VTAAKPGNYIGRFAPSPTGPLHFGSLLAAVASYLQARTHQGRWLVRIEDIDPPRAQAGAGKQILEALNAYGFDWDGPVSYQSRSTEKHQSCVDDLLERALAYPCECSRRTLSDEPRGALGPIYPGTCRNGCGRSDVTIRARTDNQPVSFVDPLQGPITQRLESESGDFVIKRRDGLIAYNLAVVVDDHLQDISEVVRGIDLLDSTPRHIHLQRLLGFATPDYLHIPVATNSVGQKLSKLTGAQGIPLKNPRPQLVAALAALRQEPPPKLEQAPLTEIWNWAEVHWTLGPLSGVTSVTGIQDSLAQS
jgi:glutamyl-Q tRNA(Asp) synthetase